MIFLKQAFPFKWVVVLALLLPVLSMFVGCGDVDRRGPSSFVNDYVREGHYTNYAGGYQGNPVTHPTNNLEEAKRLMASAFVTCNVPAGCNPAVGLVASASAEGAGQCTGFLISSQIVATNSHCIPEDLKPRGSPCAGRMSIVFPSVGIVGAVETVGCAEVIEASNISNSFRNPDYAFFRLDRPVNRVPLIINNTGLLEGLPVKVIRSTPVAGWGVYGTIGELPCRVVRRTLISFGSDPRLNPIEVLSNCPVVSGNSGSPVLAVDGSVVAIVHQKYEKRDLEEVLRPILPENATVDMARATSLGCIANPLQPGRALAPSCSGPRAEGQGLDVRGLYVPALRRATHEILRLTLPWCSRNSSQVQWGADLTREDGDHSARPQESTMSFSWEFSGLEPRCVVASAVPSQATTSVHLDLPATIMQLRFNEVLQPSFGIEPGATMPATLVIEAPTGSRGGSPEAGKVHVTLEGDLPAVEGRRVVPLRFSGDIPICH